MGVKPAAAGAAHNAAMPTFDRARRPDTLLIWALALVSVVMVVGALVSGGEREAQELRQWGDWCIARHGTVDNSSAPGQAQHRCVVDGVTVGSR